jgi:hypothetical protein
MLRLEVVLVALAPVASLAALPVPVVAGEVSVPVAEPEVDSEAGAVVEALPVVQATELGRSVTPTPWQSYGKGDHLSARLTPESIAAGGDIAAAQGKPGEGELTPKANWTAWS